MKMKDLIKKTIVVTITAIITIILFSVLMRMCITQVTVGTVSDDEMLKSEFCK